jgi:hypothetical protein
MIATPDGSRTDGSERITVERDAWDRLVVVRRRSHEPTEFRLLLLREWLTWRLFGRVPALRKRARGRGKPFGLPSFTSRAALGMSRGRVGIDSRRESGRRH